MYGRSFSRSSAPFLGNVYFFLRPMVFFLLKLRCFAFIAKKCESRVYKHQEWPDTETLREIAGLKTYYLSNFGKKLVCEAIEQLVLHTA